ncbi:MULTISPECIES: carboxypeptidase regulatory-like domain-containing protein [unclassified Nocardioides]|uniref:MSCRAMM family protein n=1 Tax=unclassified Nocardioides TaxID=2615069 RepID=UPI00005700DA|nr:MULTISPECIES: carboxypeptidase regulatory-like domain-containing protein [unclassified Nocardioides]ABL83450.1 hypothetical protein Noca_3953 [Nocardioides sp. JS614]
MLPPIRPSRAAVLSLVVGLLAAVLAVGAAPGAQARADKGLANGGITCPRLAKCPSLKLLWFDQDWNYVGQRKLGSTRSYSLTLGPGTYYLQFVDQRPAYDVSKFAPTDVMVTVRANDLTTRNVTMQAGAAITGRAVNRQGRPLNGATVVAANRGRQSFSTVADKRGRFAVGGLPQSQYSVFTFDKARTWVGKSTWAGAVKPGQIKDIRIELPTRAGELTVYVFTPNGLLGRKATLTVMSKQTGQWWTDTSSNGTFVFKGAYPGGYTAKFDGAGVWFAAEGAVKNATVRSGRPAFGKFRLTKRGGWVTGTLVDGGDPTFALAPPFEGAKGATVTLYNADGDPIATGFSDAEGNFKVEGQIATQSGLVIDVQPTEQSGGFMIGERWCHFEQASFPAEGSYGVTSGQETFVGDLAVPRTSENC